jgi:hypothetical protein
MTFEIAKADASAQARQWPVAFVESVSTSESVERAELVSVPGIR